MGHVSIRTNSQETMENQMNIQWVELDDLKKMQLKVTDLYWEYDRMSSSGQKTLDELATLVGVPTEKEMQQESKVTGEIK